MFKSKPASSRLRLTKENCLWLPFFLLMRIFASFLRFIVGCTGSRLQLSGPWLRCAGSSPGVACGLEREDPVAAVCRLSCPLPGAWDLSPPRTGIKSKSPALEAGFLTTGLPVLHILSGKYFPTSLPSIQFGFVFFSFLAVILLMEEV